MDMQDFLFSIPLGKAVKNPNNRAAQTRRNLGTDEGNKNYLNLSYQKALDLDSEKPEL